VPEGILESIDAYLLNAGYSGASKALKKEAKISEVKPDLIINLVDAFGSFKKLNVSRPKVNLFYPICIYIYIGV
jgi:hypothetical protein